MTVNHSPTPNLVVSPIVVDKPTLKTFPEAIKDLIDGKKITRQSWGDQDHYGLLFNTILSLHKAGQDNHTFYSWIVNDEDLLGDDWYVIEEKVDIN